MNPSESFLTASLSAPDAEHALIGALLLDNTAFDRMGESLRPEHFFDPTAREVFAEISSQLAAGKPCDLVTVATAMAGRVTAAELSAMSLYVPSAANIRRHAEAVVEKAKSRALLRVSAEISDLAHDQSLPIAEKVDQAQGQLARLIEDAPRDEWVSAHEGMALHTQILEDRAKGKRTVMPTGLVDLDEYLEGGLRPGELVIIGARPSMGKTAMGLSIGVHVAKTHGVGLLSMEMSHSEVNDRLIAMLGDVSLSSVKRPNKGEGLNWANVVEGCDTAKRLRLHVVDQGGLNINQVRAKARNLKRLRGLDVLVVDYIGLMAGLDPKANRNTQLGEVSRGLKALAKELSIAVLCLAQLNRKSEERADSMPQMSDLRDSGEIEQDADVILFIKRPIMADPELGEAFQYFAKCRVAKNRQGRCGDLNLSYHGDRTRFSNWAGVAPVKHANKPSRGFNL